MDTEQDASDLIGRHRNPTQRSRRPSTARRSELGDDPDLSEWNDCGQQLPFIDEGTDSKREHFAQVS